MAVSFLISFYLPLAIAVLLLLLAVLMPLPRVKGAGRPEWQLEMHLLGLSIPLGLKLKHAWLIRLTVAVIAVGLVFKALTLNFAEFFPQRLAMDVYFDERGIARNLTAFSAADLTDLDMAENWGPYLAQYDLEVRKSLFALWQRGSSRPIPQTADFIRNFLHARGETTFRVRRVGVFSYLISDSEGKLVYDFEPPGRPSWRFTTFFKLRGSSYNHIKPSLWRLIKSPSMAIRPEFKQILSIEEGGLDAPFDHVVIGLTKIYLLPIPTFTETVYFWRMPNGRTVPIGYAIYF